MKIDDNHMYHGAALLQIAEHPMFTAINTIEISGQRSRSAYLINDGIGIFLKYASEPSKIGEYAFTFTNDQLRELDEVASRIGNTANTFIALVCVKAREIACLTLDQLLALVERRRKKKGTDEEQYVVLVTATQGQSLRAYINVPGRKGFSLGKITVSRKSFPEVLFSQNPPA